MVINADLNVDELVQEDRAKQIFRIHKRLLRDPEIFELEMEKIFERTWAYVAHETEVAHGGDYKTTWIGRQPVIVSRNADDKQVYVLYNSCRHRGATVCQQGSGNANYFRCGYHGWTFNSKGDLVGLPYPKGYGEYFDPAEFGLVPVARVAIYQGFIFASLNPVGPSLEEHLGNARPYIDAFSYLGPEGITVRPDIVHKTFYYGNWKTACENPNDGYHFPATHQSMEAVRKRRGQFTSADRARSGVSSKGRLMLDLGNGHHGWGDFDGPGDWRSYSRSDGGRSFPPVYIFPNIVLIDLQIRHVVPKAHNYTELWIHPVWRKGVPDEVNEELLRRHEEFYGPAGLGAPDDWEMFERAATGALARGDEWLLYSRGLYCEVEDEVTGMRGTPEVPGGSEVTLRAIYRQWKRLMAAD